MGSALEAVLNLKAQEQQRQQFQSEQLTQAVNIFQNARQAAAQNQLAKLDLQQKQPLVDAQVQNYLSEAKARQGQEMLSNLLKGSQLKEAGQKTNDKSLFDAGEILVKSSMGIPASINQYLGKAGEMMPPTTLNPVEKAVDPTMALQTQAAEEDWRGSPTPAALEAKRKIELQTVKDKKQAEQAARSPEQVQTDTLQLQDLQRKAQEATPEGKALKAQQDLEQKIKEKEATGMAAESAGKLVMVNQAKTDIDEARKMLFPTGDISSYDHKLASKAMLPIIGKPYPDANAQKLYSRIQNAVAAKLRIETGAQANPGEVQNILNRFGINMWTKPEAAKDFLDRLENFMVDTQKAIKPDNNKTQEFKINGKIYNIPSDKVEAFKKAKGL